ncbi:MAG: Hsp70 family protein, partial [Treponema sp.]|nr:Hsp70 family protein [Treponema sp.]
IKDLGDKVNAEDKSKAEEAIADLRRALESGNNDDIKAKTETLKQVSYKIAEEVYKQSGAQGAAGGGSAAGGDAGGAAGGFGGAGNSAGADNTKSAEDADYEVVDDDKK